MSQPGQSASEPASGPSLRHLPRRYLALGLIVVAICLLGSLVLIRDNAGPSGTSTVESFSPAPSSLVASLTSVPKSVYDAVGVSSPDIPITPLKPVRAGTPLWTSGTAGGSSRPVVYFYGAEFAPYPAAERWPLVLALSRFGHFDQLGLMQSSGTTAFPGLSTYTFWRVRYESPYIDFQSVERYSSLNPTGASYLTLETPTARQAAAVAASGAGDTTFPFLDVGGRYVLSGAAFSPGALTGLSQQQIAGELTTPASPLTQALVTSSNEITAAICTVDGNRPGPVCDGHGVEAADAVLGFAPPG